MRWDQICLRIMLWSLGMTAAAGVAVIFATDNEFLLRLLGTTAATAVAAALLWPLTRVADKPLTRVAGLVGMTSVLVDYFVVLALIWAEMFLPQGRYHFFDPVFLTFWHILATAAPAVVFLLFLHQAEGWLASRVGVACCILAFIELLLGTWVPRSLMNYEERWFDAAGMTAVFGLLAVANLAGKLRDHLWRWAGVLASVVAWLMVSIHVFRPLHSASGETVFTLLTTLAAVTAYANLVLLPKLSPLHEIFRLGTVGLGTLTALLVDLIVICEIHHIPFKSFSDTLGRLAAAAGILTACATLAILVLALINRSRSPTTAVALAWIEMAITCPSCGEQQKVPLGDSTCRKCRLSFSIRISERKG